MSIVIIFFIIKDIALNTWFDLFYLLLNYARKKTETHFEILNKRIDKELSAWIVVGLIVGSLVFGVFVWQWGNFYPKNN